MERPDFVYIPAQEPELRVENRSRTLYTKTFDQAIFGAEIAQNNSVAVLTVLHAIPVNCIVTTANLQKFSTGTQPIEGTPYLLSFSDNSKDVAVACLASSGGVSWG